MLPQLADILGTARVVSLPLATAMYSAEIGRPATAQGREDVDAEVARLAHRALLGQTEV